MASLLNGDLTTLAWHVVHTCTLESQIVLYKLKETEIFFGERPTNMMLCLDSGLLMQLKVVLMKGKKVTETDFAGAGVTFPQATENPLVLPVALAIFSESGLEKLQLIM
jgi:hypothetical protein